ncbi:MAG: HlyD family efflux transporter periplasmic adaptor subunit [Parachlamydia sp.]|nr:HlyD family efflux transporter periplasmic adaptor subunit [Parachlamydia sp.]
MELKEAESVLAIAQAEVALAQLTIARTEIRAGYGGKIASVTIRLYEYPIEYKPMLAYMNDESIIAKFLIPSSLLKTVQLGQIVYIIILDANEIVTARIIRMAPDVNPTSGTVKVEAEFANPDSRWKSGMASFASFDRKALMAQYPLAVLLPEPERERAPHNKEEP